LKMEDQQKVALKVALDGHNLLLLGQSGTGKSFVVREISKALQTEGKSVSITATTGVASLSIGGITIHSWSGIGDGRFSNIDLVRKISVDEHFQKYQSNILKTDCLIIDEISMLSAKLFDQLETICRKIRGNDFYFGGIQVIASGDFFQLPPVPDNLKEDSGDFCFKSSVFPCVFKHKIVLEQVMRQDEPDFVKAINDISKGNLPDDTLNLLRRLQRTLPPGSKPLRLFARNFDREVYNACCLMDLDSEMKIYEALDEGDSNKLRKLSVSRNLIIKMNCPVMLVKNLSQNLVNGLQGVVVAMAKDGVTVKFETITTELKRETFTVYSSVEHKVVANRRQIPLVLAYGVTIHKAQGLTLDRVEVDCSNIFKPGQLGVAVGRARKKIGLQLINFEPRAVIKHDKSMFEFYNQQSNPICDNLFDCCKIPYAVMVELLEEMQESDNDSECMSEFSGKELAEFDRMLCEDVLSTTTVETETEIENEDLSQFPLTVKDIKSCIPVILVTEEQNMIHEKLNNLITHHPNSMNILLKELFQQMSELLVKHCGDTEKKNTDSKIWTKYYTELYQFSKSEEYIAVIEKCLNKKPDENDFTVFSKIFDYVSLFVLEKKTEHIKEKSFCNPKQESYPTTDAAGLGKLRYIAGRCVAKSKFHFMQMGRNNMYQKKKLLIVSECFLKVKMLDHFTSNCADLSETSKYKETLEETRRKQNLTQGLTNINDNVLDFFVEIDKSRSLVENEKMFHLQGSNTLNFVRDHLLTSQPLFEKFKNLMQNLDLNVTYIRVDEALAQSCLQGLFADLIVRFCHVADNQFRKDLIRSFALSKSESLRKRVVNTKTKKDSTVSKLNMAYILNDKSENKITSHLKLKSNISECGLSAFDNFTKKQLVSLCKAYTVKIANSNDKKTICGKLQSAIQTLSLIPKVEELSKDCVEEVDKLLLSETHSSEDQQPSTSGVSISVVQDKPVEKPEQSKKTERKKRKCSSLTYKRKKKTKTPSKKKDETLCSKCSRIYDENDDWIQCDLCDKWYDRTCQNIDEETFANLGEEDWYCLECCK